MPSHAAQRILKDQSYIGLVPTALAILGWLGLVWLAFRRRRDLVVLAVMPIFGVGGYLYRSWVTLDPRRRLVQGHVCPEHGVGLGARVRARHRLARVTSRLARYGMFALFAAFAILELRFTMYGIRDHHPIF